MRVAAVQLSSQEDVQTNLAQALSLVERAATGGATLVTLPENMAKMSASPITAAVAREMARIDGSTRDGAEGALLETLSSWAKRFSIHLLAGSVPEIVVDQEKVYNTSYLFGPTGDVITKYRKIHLFDVVTPDGQAYRESDHFLAGDACVTADVAGTRCGLSICYDLRFPELYRTLVGEGAKVLFVPAAFTLSTGKDHWLALLRARAIENQCFVIAPAQWGKHPGGRQTFGKSAIIDPWGEVIACASEGVGIAVADLDFSYLDSVRTNLPALRHRRQ